VSALSLKLREFFRGELVENEPMSRHTSYRIGGPADFYCRPKDEQDLSKLLRFAGSEGIATLTLGNGTNMLVRDGGIEGMVIHPAFGTFLLDGEELTVGSAASLKELLEFCVENSLGGIEFMAGIPGSVGGALATNAGAYGRWFGEKIAWFRGVAGDGSILEEKVDSEEFSYRKWERRRAAVIEAVRIRAMMEKSETVAARVSEYLERRRRTQPIGEMSAGSVFKNPEGEHAGALIDRAGLRSRREGDAEISSVHANFIVNNGGATAKDVLALIELARERVFEEFGVELELEILVVGRDR
jgi:UDP-N-acetylmuramate dehydrogenase